MRRFWSVIGFLGLALLGGCMGTPGGSGNNTGDDDSGDTNGTGTSAALVLRGSVDAPASAKRAARGQAASADYLVVAQSAGTMDLYTAQTGADGGFELELPDDEAGNTILVTIVSPDSQAVGPVLFGQSGDSANTGIELLGDVSLGTLALPEPDAPATVQPGDDADLDSAVIPEDVTTRLDENGAPVGVASVGKGDDAQIDQPSDNPNQQCDKDRDGLIDLFDADDNGNGMIDDSDPAGVGLDPAAAAGVTLNFFMNLKISAEQAAVYFSGDLAGIQNSLKNDTVITFEVRFDGRGGKTLTGARILPAPAPPYLSTMTLNLGSLWSSSGYALSADGANHFQAFAIAHDFINAGDNFYCELEFSDGTTQVFSRMLNYVFRSIPKLIRVGPPGALSDYSGPTTVIFDGTQDLALEWNPPVDERGMLLTGLDYRFEVFFYDASNAQIDGIDGAATWPTPPAGWDAQTRAFAVAGSALTTVSAENSFTVTLPKELFVDTVQTASGPVSVSQYKIDIAAQNTGGNCALTLIFDKP